MSDASTIKKTMRRLVSFVPFAKPLLRRRSDISYFVLRALGSIFSILPAHAVILVLVSAERIRLPLRSLLFYAYYPTTLKYLRRNPKHRFSTPLTRLLPQAEVRVLLRIGAFEEVVTRAYESDLLLKELSVALDLVQALFDLGRFNEARELALTIVSSFGAAKSAEEVRSLGVLHIIAGDIEAATRELRIAARLQPSFRQAHQNLAARDPYKYAPNALDLAAGDDGLVYSAANFAGQRVTHVGVGDVGPSIFTTALKAQTSLAARPPVYSPQTAEFLKALDINFENLKILPREWSTQIGHLGMLEILFRMRQMGWWKGDAVLSVTTPMVANPACLSLFEDECQIVDLKLSCSPDVAGELKSLEFWKAMAFNVFEMPDGTVVPWQDAGAQLMRAWEADGRGYPLRESFDARYQQSPSLGAAVRRMKKEAGMPDDAWFVCLHVREPSHYAELQGIGQTHRNADIRNYFAAVKYITDRGGWVVRMGGPKSPRLPQMSQVYDYSRSAFRSSIMDLFLIRNARYFIGTTSGLTNMAVSFGIPCALVNCITTDAQLWGDRVRFALKWIRLPDGRHLNQREISSAPWRWRFFTAEYLLKNGGVVEENTSLEILETVKEVDAIARGVPEEYELSYPNRAELIASWQRALSRDYFYGNGLPSLHYIANNPRFIDPALE